jgi:hypothetical protein
MRYIRLRVAETTRRKALGKDAKTAGWRRIDDPVQCRVARSMKARAMCIIIDLQPDRAPGGWRAEPLLRVFIALAMQDACAMRCGA